VTRLQKALIRLDADLQAIGARWALVGGFAVMLRAEARSTRDLDVVLAVSGDREAENLVRSLRLRGYSDHPTGGMMERKDGRLATVRLVSPILEEDDEAGAEIDLLIACAGVEPEICAMSTQVEVLPRYFIPVARPGHLVALKILAGRLKDHQDVLVLLRQMDSEELRLAQETLVLIEKRGFQDDPDRSLLSELGKFVDQSKDEQNF
jgi:hypothetical protein